MNRKLSNRVQGFGSVWRLAALACVILGMAGCGKSAVTSDADKGLLPEAVAVRKAFQSANPSSQGPVEEAIRLVKAGASNHSAYAEAVPLLQRLAANPKYSDEQKQALEALMEKLKSELAASKP